MGLKSKLLGATVLAGYLVLGGGIAHASSNGSAASEPAAQPTAQTQTVQQEEKQGFEAIFQKNVTVANSNNDELKTAWFTTLDDKFFTLPYQLEIDSPKGLWGELQERNVPEPLIPLFAKHITDINEHSNRDYLAIKALDTVNSKGELQGEWILAQDGMADCYKKGEMVQGFDLEVLRADKKLKPYLVPDLAPINKPKDVFDFDCDKPVPVAKTAKKTAPVDNTASSESSSPTLTAYADIGCANKILDGIFTANNTDAIFLGGDSHSYVYKNNSGMGVLNENRLALSKDTNYDGIIDQAFDFNTGGRLNSVPLAFQQQYIDALDALVERHKEQYCSSTVSPASAADSNARSAQKQTVGKPVSSVQDMLRGTPQQITIASSDSPYNMWSFLRDLTISNKTEETTPQYDLAENVIINNIYNTYETAPVVIQEPTRFTINVMRIRSGSAAPVPTTAYAYQPARVIQRRPLVSASVRIGGRNRCRPIQPRYYRPIPRPRPVCYTRGGW